MLKMKKKIFIYFVTCLITVRLIISLTLGTNSILLLCDKFTVLYSINKNDLAGDWE